MVSMPIDRGTICTRRQQIANQTFPLLALSRMSQGFAFCK